MFCADYVAAFVYHAIVTAGTMHLIRRSSGYDDAGTPKSTSSPWSLPSTCTELAVVALGLHYPSPTSRPTHACTYPADTAATPHVAVQGGVAPFNIHLRQSNRDSLASFVIPTCVGLVSGLAASASLYPFDFVRAGVLKPGLRRILSAGSTVPYVSHCFLP
jgi:hypothetical protein